MKTFVDDKGGLHLPEDNYYHVELLIEESNKNEPGPVIKRCKDENGKFSKERLKQVLDEMSEEEFTRYCMNTIKLHQYADKYNALAATYWIGIPNEKRGYYFNLVHPLAKPEEFVISKINPPSEGELQALKERV